MDTPSAKTELVRWDVPFAEWRGLSTWVITESFDSFAIVVAPLSDKRPEDNYPKYLSRFDKVLTLLNYEEAFWKTVGLPVIGVGSRLEWLDNGPPRTDTAPTNQPARFYRVLHSP